MKIVILGAGPAGLYCGLLIKKAHPTYDITIVERNPADVTYGWGVVFSDRTLASFQRADYTTYEQIRDQFVIWDAIDILYRGTTIRCGGHVIASISRKHLLNVLQRRCAELSICLQFEHEIQDLAQLGEYDLLIAADGINSFIRKTYPDLFPSEIEPGKARYIWLGANKVLDAFTFIFRENEHGLFQVHAYPFSGTTSTFIIECDEASWLNAGLDRADEAGSLAYCQQLLADDLKGAQLLSNNSKWINFPTLKTKRWHHKRFVLLGDAAHTAHFSIGSGTKLAMEDAIALAGALERYPVLETALNEYELERRPVVEVFQRAAKESQVYFETIKRYLGLEPMQFAFQLLTRSGRITYDDLRLRDPRFGDLVDRWFAQHATEQLAGSSESSSQHRLVAPPPLFSPLPLCSLILPDRVVLNPRISCPAYNGQPSQGYVERLLNSARSGVGLLLAGPVAISASARITPDDPGIYQREHVSAWAALVEEIHTRTNAKVGIQLNHAGRRGATQPRTRGLDRPLREGSWPLLSASALPYTVHSQIPAAMERAEMDRVREEFVQAAKLADEAGFDLLQLHLAHGYLLASFLSPLTNQHDDDYGGILEHRARYPLEVFHAVQEVWPQGKPIAIALPASDYVKGGLTIEDAVRLATLFKEDGCDLVQVLTGQTIADGEVPYSRGYLTAFSDRIRNGAGIPTLVGGYLTTTDEVNTVLAAGRADLCVLEIAQDE